MWLEIYIKKSIFEGKGKQTYETATAQRKSTDVWATDVLIHRGCLSFSSSLQSGYSHYTVSLNLATNIVVTQQMKEYSTMTCTLITFSTLLT